MTDTNAFVTAPCPDGDSVGQGGTGDLTATTFRSVMSGFVTGVCMAATRGSDGTPSGLTVNSFTSVSLEPPLVSICIDLRSRTLPAIQAAGCFAVSVLGADQQDIARAGATRNLDWSTLPSVEWETGAPILAGAVAALDCRTVGQHEAGDHMIVLGQVVRCAWLHRHSAPLTYHLGRYGAAPQDGR